MSPWRYRAQARTCVRADSSPPPGPTARRPAARRRAVARIVAAAAIGKPGEGVLRQPEAIAVSPAGRVYVGDQFSHLVQVFSRGGSFEGQWGEAGLGPRRVRRRGRPRVRLPGVRVPGGRDERPRGEVHAVRAFRELVGEPRIRRGAVRLRGGQRPLAAARGRHRGGRTVCVRGRHPQRPPPALPARRLRSACDRRRGQRAGRGAPPAGACAGARGGHVGAGSAVRGGQRQRTRAGAHAGGALRGAGEQLSGEPADVSEPIRRGGARRLGVRGGRQPRARGALRPLASLSRDLLRLRAPTRSPTSCAPTRWTGRAMCTWRTRAPTASWRSAPRARPCGRGGPRASLPASSWPRSTSPGARKAGSWSPRPIAKSSRSRPARRPPSSAPRSRTGRRGAAVAASPWAAVSSAQPGWRSRKTARSG